MIASFEDASAVRPTGPGEFEATVPDGWQQGRGAFGGLVYGMLARAMEHVVADPARRLRTFTGDIEYRSAGPMPFPAARDAETAGYLREKIPPSRRDAPSMIALLDAWWPTLWSIDTLYRPMATVSFAGQLLIDPARLDPHERLFHAARMAAFQDGYFVELRELWSGDVCVGMNQQTYVVLG